VPLADFPSAATIVRALEYQLHSEDRTGSIEVGKAADLIVLDQNILGLPVEKISETQVLVTMCPAGPAGPAGPRGDKGDRGPRGRTPTVKVTCRFVRRRTAVRCTVTPSGSSPRLTTTARLAGSKRRVTRSGRRSVAVEVGGGRRLPFSARVQVRVRVGKAIANLRLRVGTTRKHVAR
jgi:Amidohydrolase family